MTGVRRYDGRPLDDVLLVIGLTQGCMLELPQKLEMEHKEVSYREVRDFVIAYIKRRGGTSNQPVPMDIGNQEEEEYDGFPHQGAGRLQLHGRGSRYGTLRCRGLVRHVSRSVHRI